jgi:hypothetical protein
MKCFEMYCILIKYNGLCSSTYRRRWPHANVMYSQGATRVRFSLVTYIRWPWTMTNELRNCTQDQKHKLFIRHINMKPDHLKKWQKTRVESKGETIYHLFILSLQRIIFRYQQRVSYKRHLKTFHFTQTCPCKLFTELNARRYNAHQNCKHLNKRMSLNVNNSKCKLLH